MGCQYFNLSSQGNDYNFLFRNGLYLGKKTMLAKHIENKISCLQILRADVRL